MNAPEKPHAKARFDTIGKPRRRVDGRAKAIGELRFADDLVLPRMLHAKLLRSPHPHALIERYGHTHPTEQLDHGGDILQVRHITDLYGLLGQ